MKKTIYSILALIIISAVVLCGCGESDNKSFSQLSDSEIEEQLKFAEDCAASYYNLLMSDNEKLVTIINGIEKQTGDEELLNNEISQAITEIKELLPDTLTDNLKEYMAAKLFYESCGLVLTDLYEEITKSEFKVVDKKIVNDKLVCKVNCTVSFKYVERSSEPSPSSSSATTREQIQLVIENAANPSVIDWYGAAPSSFGSKIRTYELDLFDESNWLSNANEEEISKKLTEVCTSTFISYLIKIGESEYKSFSQLSDSEIEEQLKFAEDCAASYYNLLMSDNEKLVTIINGIEKQTDDEELLNNEISKAITEIEALLPDTLSADLKEYMAAKLFNESCYLVLTDRYEEITNSEFKVDEWKIVNDKLVCKVNCTVSFKTVQRGSDASPVFSKTGKQIQLVIENAANPSVIDWYCAAPSSFGSKIRTYELDLFDESNWLSHANEEEISKKLTEVCTSTFISCLNHGL